MCTPANRYPYDWGARRESELRREEPQESRKP